MISYKWGLNVQIKLPILRYMAQINQLRIQDFPLRGRRPLDPPMNVDWNAEET